MNDVPQETLELPLPVARSGSVERLRSIAPLAVNVFGIFTFALAIVVFFSLTTSAFVSYDNLVIVLSTVVVIGVVSIGQMFAIVSGGFDLSVSGVVPLGAVVYAKLSNGGFSVVEAAAVVVALGAVVGSVNGVLITKLQINPLITTFGMLSITGGIALQITKGVTIPINDASAGVLADPSVARIPWAVWVLFGLVIATSLVLRYTTFGRSVYALGGNRDASWLAGIRVDLLTIGIYAICAAFAAFAGVIAASQLLAGSGSVGTDAALTSVAAVILGGAALTGGEGGPIGTLTGVLVLGMLANGMTLMQISTFWEQIVTGAVLLLAVGFGRLRGLVGRA